MSMPIMSPAWSDWRDWQGLLIHTPGAVARWLFVQLTTASLGRRTQVDCVFDALAMTKEEAFQFGAFRVTQSSLYNEIAAPSSCRLDPVPSPYYPDRLGAVYLFNAETARHLDPREFKWSVRVGPSKDTTARLRHRVRGSTEWIDHVVTRFTGSDVIPGYQANSRLALLRRELLLAWRPLGIPPQKFIHQQFTQPTPASLWIPPSHCASPSSEASSLLAVAS